MDLRNQERSEGPVWRSFLIRPLVVRINLVGSELAAFLANQSALLQFNAKREIRPNFEPKSAKTYPIGLKIFLCGSFGVVIPRNQPRARGHIWFFLKLQFPYLENFGQKRNFDPVYLDYLWFNFQTGELSPQFHGVE